MRFLQVGTRHADLPDVTANQHHAQLHGTTDHNTRSRDIWLTAPEAFGTGAQAIRGSFPAGLPALPIAHTADGLVSWEWMTPYDMAAGTPLAWIEWYTEDAGAGNLAMRLDALSLGNGANPTAAGSTTSLSVAVPGAAQLVETAITFPIAVASQVRYRLSVGRASVSDGATDTFTGGIYILGLRLRMTADH